MVLMRLLATSVFFLLFYISNAIAFVQEISPGVFVHIGKHLDVDEGYDGDICNIGFIVGDDAIAVIDTGGNYLVGNQLRQYITENFKQPIKYVINTHAHLDHVYGNISFDEAEIYGHENLPKSMKLRANIYDRLNEKYLGKIASSSPLVVATKFVEIGQDVNLDLGNRMITLSAYLVAHTEADLTVYDQKTQVLWSGDLVFKERTPVIDGNIHGFIKALQSINELQISQIVPGHGIPSSKEYATQPMLDYLSTLRDDIRQYINEGQSLEYALEHAAKSEKEKWLLFDIQNKRNVNQVYPMMEWE